MDLLFAVQKESSATIAYDVAAAIFVVKETQLAMLQVDWVKTTAAASSPWCPCTGSGRLHYGEPCGVGFVTASGAALTRDLHST